jgi:ubiquinone/menaquinone biosynthesis C-methylase UbiE
MTGRARTYGVLLAVTAAAAVAVVRHGRCAATPRPAAGGILVGDAVAYDTLTRLAFGSFFGHVAADVAAVTRDDARVLEVGCGPGHLSIVLARRHGLDVTGVDLDPAMIERARTNAGRAFAGEASRPMFLVSDVASLAFPDRSFDLVVSTLSMHHWADPTAGLAEIGRVLRPDGRVLVWDLRPGVVPFHPHLPDPIEHMRDGALRVVTATAWPWPWRFALTQRIDMVRADT